MLFFKKSTENSGVAFGAAFLALTMFGADFAFADTASLLDSARVYPGENNGCNRYPFLSKVDFPSDENAYAIKSGNGFEKGDLICATEDVSVQYTLKDLLESKQVEKSFISDLLNNDVISRDQYDHYVPRSERGWKETLGDDWRLLFSAPKHLGLASDVRLLSETAVGLGLLYGFHRSGLLGKTASGVKSCFVGVKNAISYICCCGCCRKSRKAKDTEKPSLDKSDSTDFTNNPTLVKGQANESLDTTTEYSTTNTEETKSDVDPSPAGKNVLKSTSTSSSSSSENSEIGEEQEDSSDDSFNIKLQGVIVRLGNMRDEFRAELNKLRDQFNGLQNIVMQQSQPQLQAPTSVMQPQPQQPMPQFGGCQQPLMQQPQPQLQVQTPVTSSEAKAEEPSGAEAGEAAPVTLPETKAEEGPAGAEAGDDAAPAGVI